MDVSGNLGYVMAANGIRRSEFEICLLCDHKSLDYSEPW